MGFRASSRASTVMKLRRFSRFLFWASLAYGLLLGASTLVRYTSPAALQELPNQTTTRLPALDAQGQPQGDRMITLVAREFRAERADAPVVLLLHGSPMAGESFDALRPLLEGDFHLLIPDFPGLGRSTRVIPDYSVETHAHYLARWLGQHPLLHARAAAGEETAVHVVAYSMAGGVALHLERIRPGTTRSLVLLSAIGVQEYELFGNYQLNHAVHGAQLAVIWAIQNLTPHFGWWDTALLNTSYARNFFDTDQRTLRALLRRFEPPTLIYHGEADVLVPVQAAREHARLLPQAEVEINDGEHIFLFHRPAEVGERLTAFWAAVEAGRALRRGDAPREAQLAAQEPFVRDHSWQYMGMAVVLIFLLLAVATFVSEDLACIGAGLIAAHGLITLPVAIAACFTGIFVGDNLLYLAGRLLGPQALRRRPLRWFVSEAAVKQAESWFQRRGPLVIILTRFIPGSRTGTYFAAGALRAPYGTFLLYFGLAAALWTPILVSLSAMVGRTMLDWYEAYAAFALPAFLLAGLLFYGLLHYGFPLLTHRGRRLLVGRWRRATRFEFWPRWQVYLPVVLRVAWDSVVRFRQPLLFTATNPGMPHSGVIGESKSAILQALAPAGEAIAPWTLLPADATALERAGAFDAFVAEHGLPVVLKPDTGQRGLGVKVIRTREAGFAQLREHPGLAWIAQAYVGGAEFGVFYARRPAEATGQVISVTVKEPTAVVGNGHHALEKLILEDDRAICLAPFFFAAHAERLTEVPRAGERVALTELGTHCRGAQFFDGNAHVTPALTAAIDRLAQSWEPAGGFYFGRFDLKAPDLDHFERGEGLKVLELNGITSEATHIYDPRHGARYGQRTLIAQWQRALEIAAENTARGVRPSSLRALLRDARAAWRAQATLD